MVDSPTPRARMTRDIGAGSASSGSPLAPPKASPCVLDRPRLARPRAHAAAESTIHRLSTMAVEGSRMPDVLVLCYHALSPDWPAALSTTPERFREQLELLLARGYRGATFAGALAAPAGGRTFAVTFDDAYRSVLERARPIMDELGVPGTVFVPTDWAGSPEPMRWEGIDQWLGGPHEPEMVCMRWQELRELLGAGWEVGSHTCSHPHLTRFDAGSLKRELVGSRKACSEGLGAPCRSIAYPYGDVNARVVAAA